MSKQPTTPDLKVLWGKSHNQCALCKSPVIKRKESGSEYPIGEMAHIYGENPTAARYNPDLDERFVNSYENRILLCPNCHTEIDKNEEDYTTDKLFKIKKEHEEECERTLRSLIPDITFSELDIALKFLISDESEDVKETIVLIPPKEKIQKNDLSSEVERFITMGMLKTGEVKKFLNEMPDIHFPNRLRVGFVYKYLDLKKQYYGDELFYELWEFASGHSNDFKIKAAGLAVLTYFFELCDVFEK